MNDETIFILNPDVGLRVSAHGLCQVYINGVFSAIFFDTNEFGPWQIGVRAKVASLKNQVLDAHLLNIITTGFPYFTGNGGVRSVLKQPLIKHIDFILRFQNNILFLVF